MDDLGMHDPYNLLAYSPRVQLTPTVEPFYCRHPWESLKCPDNIGGILNILSRDSYILFFPISDISLNIYKYG